MFSLVKRILFLFKFVEDIMKRDKLPNYFRWLLICLIIVSPFGMISCDDDKEEIKGDRITINEDQLNISFEAEETSASIKFTALSSWTATVKEKGSSNWLTLSSEQGVGGIVNLNLTLKKNTTKDNRTAIIIITCGITNKEINVVQAGSTILMLDEANIKDFNKYYKPTEFSNMDMLRNDAKWSWFRSAQSEHFVVFWEIGFGDNPNAETVDAALRVDIDDLLEKAEQFYKTNIEILKFAELGEGKSYLDKYKMQIYLLYQTEWLATGSGYDNTIGALWVNPGTCQPVGSTIAHEIGHSFQYQVYCDKILQGNPNDLKYGFRYGYEGSNGGNGFWEQCAQWQSYQDYPEQLFANYHFDVWLANYHRHFEHEWMRYASYWLQSYWTAKHGIETVGNIWRQSVYPEDAISTYMRLYCGNQWEIMSNELYDYAVRMATFDIDGIREYSNGYLDKYSTKLYPTEADYYQVAYASCPGTTGFNVIALNVPKPGTTISANFKGLAPGAYLAPDDPGEYMEAEAVVGRVTQYNAGSASNTGWRYGFVALKSDGTRIYGEMNHASSYSAQFTVPTNTEKLYFVVLGAPKQYKAHPWDEKEKNDQQWPYKVKFEGTDLLGNFSIDETADPKDITLTYNVNCDASAQDYILGTIDLKTNQQLAQAFVIKPSAIESKVMPVGSEPADDRIVIALEQTDGTYSYASTANNGFWCKADGNIGNWGDTAPVYVEFNGLTLTYGHRFGVSKAETKYTICPTFIYIKNGRQYKAKFIINMQFE